MGLGWVVVVRVRAGLNIMKGEVAHPYAQKRTQEKAAVAKK